VPIGRGSKTLAKPIVAPSDLKALSLLLKLKPARPKARAYSQEKSPLEASAPICQLVGSRDSFAVFIRPQSFGAAASGPWETAPANGMTE
jgi:hypothetical protein